MSRNNLKCHIWSMIYFVNNITFNKETPVYRKLHIDQRSKHCRFESCRIQKIDIKATIGVTLAHKSCSYVRLKKLFNYCRMGHIVEIMIIFFYFMNIIDTFYFSMSALPFVYSLSFCLASFAHRLCRMFSFWAINMVDRLV